MTTHPVCSHESAIVEGHVGGLAGRPLITIHAAHTVADLQVLHDSPRHIVRDGTTQNETTVWQYMHGVSDTTAVSPDGYSLDSFYLARPGAAELQLDLFGDYKSNVALYPTFQKYFRTYKPRFLAV